jgi:hypothetical protein
MRTVGQAIVAMAEMAEGKAARRRQVRADQPSPAKAAAVAARQVWELPADHPFA